MEVINERLNNDRQAFSAEQKRMKSVNDMKKSYQKQKNAIKAALANVDSKLNTVTKTLFKDDENEDGLDNNFEVTENLQRNQGKKDSTLNSLTKTIFDDEEESDDGVEYNFEVKEHLQGKQGRKLMELQSKFKHDKRFAMDERFLDDENEEEIKEDSAENTSSTDEDEDGDIEITKEEKLTELSILEDVLGKKFVKMKDTKDDNTQSQMSRFNPDDSCLPKCILEGKELLKEKKKKRKKGEESEIIDESQVVKRPLVSKEKFYTVSENLKETFKQNEPFSFINMFDSHKESAETRIENVAEYPITEEKQTSNGRIFENGKRNPFQYDSSDGSDTEQFNKIERQSEKVTEDKDQSNPQNISFGATQSWRESFFFKDDDYRFQEGIDFVRKFKDDDNSEFQQIRRNIKKIVRAKVRNNQRKNKPFKKKLGGKKMIKMKKAMKNK